MAGGDTCTIVGSVQWWVGTYTVVARAGGLPEPFSISVAATLLH